MKRVFKLKKLKENERLRKGFKFKFTLNCQLENIEERRKESIGEAISREFRHEEFPALRISD
jgi:hypothetical protein